MKIRPVAEISWAASGTESGPKVHICAIYSMSNVAGKSTRAENQLFCWEIEHFHWILRSMTMFANKLASVSTSSWVR